jgi:branched-chain amino acid aminotransferase
MALAVLNKFIYNNNVYDTTQFEKIYIEKNPSVYEVIRVIDGVPLFCEDHYSRLLNSVSLLGYNINLSLEDMKKNILEIVRVNEVKDYNLEVIVNNLEADTQNIYYFFLETNYPNDIFYKNGISTVTYRTSRDNPNAKVIYTSIREEINKFLEISNSYEALLINANNEVTEGSRSNLFFIKDEKVFTSPGVEVLLGITRNKIITLCHENNIEVIETPIPLSTIYDYDACFITGTSPKVLPIYKIDNHIYKMSNLTLNRIISIYNNHIMEYIKEAIS